ncbi:MAG: hypothetical protein ACYTFY_14510, partial [Planctomycetota bacterium]
RLEIPESWDLDRYSGDCRKGDLVMDDGKRQIFDAQWAALGGADLEYVEKQYIKKLKGVEVSKRIELGGSRSLSIAEHQSAGKIAYLTVLQEELNRFIIFRFFDPGADIKSFAKGIISPLSKVIGIEKQHWKFFSTEFTLPEGFLLTDSSFNVGCMTLVFEREGRRLTIWDLSLLDQIEKNGSFADYSVSLVNSRHAKKFRFAMKNIEWSGKDNFFVQGRKKRRWLFEITKLLTANRLVWLEGAAERSKNRFTAILFEHYSPEDLEWLDGLMASFRKEGGDE